MTSEKKSAGRPKLAPGQGYKAGRRNISLNAQSVAEIDRMAGIAAAEMGFRPTLAQTVLWMVAKIEKGSR